MKPTTATTATPTTPATTSEASVPQKTAALDWTESEDENSSGARLIHEELRSHVEAQVGSSNRRAFILCAKDQKGDFAGGLRGFSHWSWMHISHVFVRPEHRSSRIGRELLLRAETEARSRNCRGIYLDTFDPRARQFYEENGYRVFGEIPGFPPGLSRIFMMKTM